MSSNGTPPDPAAMKMRFFRYFQHEVTALQEQMERLSNTALAGGERNDAVEHCLAGIARLSQEVKDASSYVPTYDQKTYSEAVKALSEKLQNVRNSFAPRPKFTFKTARKNASAISLNDAAEIVATERKANLGYASASDISSSVSNTPAEQISPPNEPTGPMIEEDVTLTEISDAATAPTDGLLHPEAATKERAEESAAAGGEGALSPVRRPSFSKDESILISGNHDAHIILPSSAAHAVTTGTLSNLRHCIVDMSLPTASSAGTEKHSGKSFAGLTLKSIKDSLIVCGRVEGPAHVTELTNCVVVVACRQFRMHECKGVDVYLECGSRPIIEGCEEVRFAPLPEVFINGERLAEQNQWDQVDDFKWLKSEPSPNWKVLPESERVAEEVWQSKVPGGPSSGIDEILNAVGVKSSGKQWMGP